MNSKRSFRERKRSLWRRDKSIGGGFNREAAIVGRCQAQGVSMIIYLSLHLSQPIIYSSEERNDSLLYLSRDAEAEEKYAQVL